MTITFENDNDVIVYTLERIIAYARQTQQVFVAHSVWWLPLIIGLQQGLVIHIDNIQSRIEKNGQIARTEAALEPREVSTTPRDIQEHPRGNIGTGTILQNRKPQVQSSNDDISDLDLEDNRQEGFVEGTKQFIQKSRKERKAFNRQK
jgi:hypothetical protein